MYAKKTKFQEEATSEILVADTNLESGADASDVEDKFEEEEYDSKPQQKMNHKCNNWQIPNPWGTLRKEHTHSSFCWSS